MQTTQTRKLVVAAALLTLFTAGNTLVAQSRATPKRVGRATRATGRPRPQDAKAQAERKVAFGDVMIDHIGAMEGDFSAVRITGPNVTVDSVDRAAGSETHMVAREFYATKAKGGAVDKIEATGAVRFSGVRPAVGRKGTQTFEGSGSKGIYYKAEGRLVLEGPVSYYVEQPTASGTGKQWVRGTSDRAEFDENKKLLVLIGRVRAKAVDPEALQEDKPSEISVDRAQLDFSTPKVTFKFTNESGDGGSLRFNPKLDQKKAEKKDDKKGGS